MTSLFRLRRATADDAAAIALIHAESWRVGYHGVLPDGLLGDTLIGDHFDRWRRLLALERPGRATLVMEHGAGGVTGGATGGLVGFASSGPCRARALGYDAELYTLYVLPRFWRRRIGARLIAAAAQRHALFGARSLMLWTLAANQRGRAFYRDLGGVEIARQIERFGDHALPEIAYGWPRIGDIAAACAALSVAG